MDKTYKVIVAIRANSYRLSPADPGYHADFLDDSGAPVASLDNVVFVDLMSGGGQQRISDDGAGDGRLRETARQLVEYYDAHGAREFNRHFGTSDLSGEYFVEFLRGFLSEGEASEPPLSDQP